MPDEDEHQTGVGLDHWGDQFPDTHWSLLISAQKEDPDPSARERSLTDLCRRYWYPLYAYLRKRGRSSHDAQDLTQGFFAYLLNGDRIAGLDPARGKFRSYLLGAMDHFLNDRRKYENAQKRGGGMVPISIEKEMAEHRFQNEPSDDLTAEKHFDRKWALTVITEAQSELGQEFTEKGKGPIFNEIGEYLLNSPEPGEYAAIATRLDLKEDNLRAIVSRMRKKFKEILRSQVRATVSSDEEIDEEIQYLLNVFS